MMLTLMALHAAFTCSVVSVHDGDTFTCQGGTRVRLAAIDAPEVGDCPSYRRCAPGDGQASRRTLDAMAYRRQVRCEPNGTSYDRVTAFCTAPGSGDLSCAMLRARQAIYLPHFDRTRRLAGCGRQRR